MDTLFEFADELGPEKIVHIHHASTGLKAIVVIDNVAAGPSIGGVRMASDVSVDECVRLARAMTLKNAAAGLAHGGGKSVLFADSTQSNSVKEKLMRSFARAIETLTDYIPGPDMGTNERCMAWVNDEIGRAVGLPSEIGGIPLDEIGATGFGLAAAVDVAAAKKGLALEGARVAVQGFGSVGRHAARFLARRGAVLVAASDSQGALIDESGIDVDALIALKTSGACVAAASQENARPRDEILDVECEIWIPAARPDVIRADNVGRLRTSLVAQGANIAVTPEAEAILHRKGVISLPDFIANAGGVICAAVEYHNGTQRQAFEAIEEKIQRNVGQVLEQSQRDDIPPREVALAMAETRVRRAMSYRRYA